MAPERQPPTGWVKWALLALAMFLPIAAPIAGGLVGYAVDGSRAAMLGAFAGVIGLALLIGAAWIACGLFAARQEWRIWREGNRKTDAQP